MKYIVYCFFLLLSLYSIFVVEIKGFANDPGVGWHLKTGRYISDNLSIPFTDPFLYSNTIRPWVADQWFADLLLYRLFLLGDWPVVYTVIISFFIATFFILIFQRNIQNTKSVILAAVLALISFKLAQIHLILRPVVFGIFSFSVLTVLVDEWLKKRNMFYICFIGLLFLLWANIHGTFILGLLYLAVRLCAEQFFIRNSLFRQYIACLLISFSCTLINPYFIDLYRDILQLAESSYFMHLNEEWLPPSIDEPIGQLFYVCVITLFGTAFLGVKRKKLTSDLLVHLLPLCIFTILAAKSVRMVPFFALLLSPYLAKIFSTLYSIKSKDKISTKPYFLVTISAIFFLLIFSFFSPELLYKGRLGPSETKFPYNGLDYLKRNRIGYAPTVVISDPAWGGFITWYGDDAVLAVIDDRNQLLGEQEYRDFYQAVSLQEGSLEGYLESKQAKILLLRRKSQLAELLESNSRYKILYADEVCIIFRHERTI